MNSPDEEKEIAGIIERLEKQFPDVPPREVALVVHEAHSAFHGRPIRNYVPVLVEGDARERLKSRPPEQ